MIGHGLACCVKLHQLLEKKNGCVRDGRANYLLNKAELVPRLTCSHDVTQILKSTHLSSFHRITELEAAIYVFGSTFLLSTEQIKYFNRPYKIAIPKICPRFLYLEIGIILKSFSLPLSTPFLFPVCFCVPFIKEVLSVDFHSSG